MSGGLLALAEDVAREAGALLLERFGGPATGITSKSSRTDLVSDADRAAETLIVERIHRERPRDAILAEEGGGGEGASGIRWLVDPLDGTINYLWGVPQWSVSVAAADADGTVAGVVHDPGRGETFTALRGEGAFLGERRLRMEAGPALDQALVATGFSYVAERRTIQARLLARVLPAVRDVRRFGSAALDLAWLAAGRVDGYYETGLNPWDWAAGALLVREAGGVVVQPAGDSLVAAAPGLIEPLVALVT